MNYKCEVLAEGFGDDWIKLYFVRESTPALREIEILGAVKRVSCMEAGRVRHTIICQIPRAPSDLEFEVFIAEPDSKEEWRKRTAYMYLPLPASLEAGVRRMLRDYNVADLTPDYSSDAPVNRAKESFRLWLEDRANLEHHRYARYWYSQDYIAELSRKFLCS